MFSLSPALISMISQRFASSAQHLFAKLSFSSFTSWSLRFFRVWKSLSSLVYHWSHSSMMFWAFWL